MNISKILKSGSIITFINIVTAVLGVSGVFYISNTLGLEKSGQYYFVISFIMLVVRVLNVAPWQAVIKYYEEKKHVISQSLKLELLSAMFTIFVFILVHDLALNNVEPSISQLVFWLGIVTILCRSNGTLIGFLRVKEKFILVEMARCFGELIKLTIFILTSLNSSVKIEDALLAFMVGEVFVFITYICVAINSASSRIEMIRLFFKIKIEKDFLKYSLFANANASLIGSVKTADEYILGILSDSASVGIYKLIKTTASTIGLITDPLQMLIFPSFVRSVRHGNVNHVLSKIKRVHITLASISVLIIILTYSIWPYVFYIVEGTISYENRVELIIYLLSVIVLANFFYLQPICMALGFVLEVFYINIISVTLFFIMCFVTSVILTGIESVAISYCIFSLSSIVLRLYLLKRTGYVVW